MITEDYCSFEVAKLLKEKGFNELCSRLIREDGEYIEKPSQAWNGMTKKQKSEFYLCPTHQMACAWIRERYGFHIFADYSIKFNLWQRNIREIDETGVVWSIGGFSSPEEAVEEGVKFVLENLI